MVTASCFASLKLISNPGRADAWLNAEASLGHSTEHGLSSPRQTPGSLDASAQGLEAARGKAGATQGYRVVLEKAELAAHGIKESGGKKAPAAKLDQSPAEICRLPAKGTGRGEAVGGRGLWSWLPACTKEDKNEKKSVIPQPEVNYKTHPSRVQGDALDQTRDAGV